ncbi:hypothetical protein BH09MYX1_BH09MYX1_54250 [soil metagenome]
MMKRIWSHGLAAVALAGLIATACTDNDASVFVVGALSPPTPSADGTCIYQTTVTGPFLFTGTLDVALGNSYTPVMLLGNQLVARGNAQESRIETNRVQIQGSVVRITDAAGTELRSYTVPAAGFIDVASGTTPGYGSAATTLVDPDTASTLRTQLSAAPGTTRTVLTYTKFFGQTLGGTHVESGEYQFPVTVCLGCTVSFPAGSTDTAKTQPNCLAAIGGSSGTVATPCVSGQDQNTDCRLCQGNPFCAP